MESLAKVVSFVVYSYVSSNKIYLGYFVLIQKVIIIPDSIYHICWLNIWLSLIVSNI